MDYKEEVIKQINKHLDNCYKEVNEAKRLAKEADVHFEFNINKIIPYFCARDEPTYYPSMNAFMNVQKNKDMFGDMCDYDEETEAFEGDEEYKKEWEQKLEDSKGWITIPLIMQVITFAMFCSLLIGGLAHFCAAKNFKWYIDVLFFWILLNVLAITGWFLERCST